MMKLIMNLSVLSVSLLLTLAAFPKVAYAQASYEVMCRNKAKEIAAETYKSCVTEIRQSHVEQIRKEYQEKLAGLKAHYDTELKKIGGGTTKPKPSNKNATKVLDSDSNFRLTESKPVVSQGSAQKRKSGARELPAKKVEVSAPISTESIDLSTATEAVNTENQSQLETKSADSSDQIEVVELPTEAE